MNIYDSIGGAPAVRAAVDDFYTRVLADARLAPFLTWTASRLTSARSSRPRSAARTSSRAGTWPPRTPGSASGPVTSTPS